MNNNDIIAFFDKYASVWDSHQERKEDVIRYILDKSEAFNGKEILDVACGTGVLFPDYILRGCNVTGIDISPEMVRIAKSKYPEIEIICDDIHSYAFKKKFDTVMIYNAFPHFEDPVKLFSNLHATLKANGRLTVAHGISEKEVAECHSSAAKHVSAPLPSKEKLAEMMSDLFEVDTMISDENMYMVTGIKK